MTIFFGASVFLRLTFLTTTPPSLAGSRVRDVEEPYLEFFSIKFFFIEILTYLEHCGSKLDVVNIITLIDSFRDGFIA